MAATCFSFALLLLLLFVLLPQLSFQQTLTSFTRFDSPWAPSENRTLSSPNATFAAGFQPLRGSPGLYLFSVWYQSDPNKTLVWSHDPNCPVNASYALSVFGSAVLSLNDSSGTNLLPGVRAQRNASLVLSEGGNLIFGNWSSFDHPTDTILPNQPMPQSGRTLISGRFQFFNSSTLIFGSSDVYWTTNHKLLNYSARGEVNQEEGNVQVAADLGTVLPRRLTLDPDGNLRLWSLQGSGSWRVVWRAVQEICTIHGTCGPNFICSTDAFDVITCICPPGFRQLAGKCERKKALSRESKFLRLDFVNFTGGANQTDRKSPDFASCESQCLANPNCLGFAYKFDGSQYCVHQIDRLLDGYLSPGSQTSFFLKVDISETDGRGNFTGLTTSADTICPVQIKLPLPPNESKSAVRNLAIICSLFALELIGGVGAFWAFLRKYSQYRSVARVYGLEFLPAGGPKRFSYAELKEATRDFCDVLGQGGFGIVYRGELPDHRVVAVKSLKNVGRAEAEFWAEVTIIARMHHLNLVRMWGFCAEKGQRMLVYEYISNGSLDKFLFRPSSEDRDRPLLDWGIRYRIAIGVARAIAYLHEECLEWVLHCDIKPENILLEDDFCPKVSDFGLSKLTNKEEKVTMSRIRGTRGYLAPEWVRMDEPITAKADVYSFGMVLLEIVSGVRNTEFTQSGLDSDDWYFPTWAYEKVYNDKRVEEILDRRILALYESRVHLPMVDRMVKTAMWCLQDRPEMRPSMGKVAKMLEGTVDIMEPEKPTIFFIKRDSTIGT